MAGIGTEIKQREPAIAETDVYKRQGYIFLTVPTRHFLIHGVMRMK